MKLLGSDFYTLYQPYRCELRVYLKKTGQAEAPPGPYVEILRRLGERHEAARLNAFPELVNLSIYPWTKRPERTQEAIRERAPVLYHPLFHHSACLGSQTVELWGEPDLLLWRGGGYVIQDMKISRRINEKDHPETLRQLGLYGWLLEKTVGQAPAGLEVYTGSGEEIEIPYDGGRAAFEALETIQAVWRLSREPYSPVGWTKCGQCGFRPYCWTRAEKERQVALVAGIDRGLAQTLHAGNVRTVRQLLEQYNETTLAAVKRPHGTTLRKVGRLAPDILRQARAQDSGNEILLAPPEMPASPNLVMFDLEGLPPQLDETQKIYLWGLQVFGERPGAFQPGLAGFGPEGDEAGWRAFLRQAEAIFSEYGDIPFVHWHHYERTNLSRYMQRYGDPEGIAARVLENLCDLLVVTKKSLVLPLPSYSLKVVERYVGFQRRMDEYGGDWSMAKYIEAVETEDSQKREENMASILKYNQEDLAATWAVYLWLKAKVPAGA